MLPANAKQPSEIQALFIIFGALKIGCQGRFPE
jgi:hypothetical protein